MSLWLLEPIDKHSGPWNPWYDKCFGAVVRAKTETEARQVLAGQTNAYDEGPDAWLNPALSTCVQLSARGKAEVLLREEHWA